MPEETVQTPTFDQAAQSAMETLSKESAVVDSKTDDTQTETEQPSEQTQTETQAQETVNEEGLLSDEEVATLDDSGKANYKKMQKAFTEKTQKLAAERKEIEQLKAYREVI
jgi:hypothetical protein